MTKSVPHQFASITARLEDAIGIAVEGQSRDNSPDMQVVLAMHLRTGLAALDTEVRAIAKALEGRSQ
jgi:ActR/RegA family two-component response regulator